jgi:SAM-dependent methyltransferase
MMARYHRRDEQTAALIWRDARGRSWIRSGDVGKLDAQGYITLVDRKKDMIISGGFNVFPTDIEAIVGDATDLSGFADGDFATVIASNFLEHLEHDAIDALLDDVARVLRTGGRLILIQPNFRLDQKRYFDDYTHRTIWTDTSLTDLLVAHGFRIERCEPRFLPLTMKSRLSFGHRLVPAYLRLPFRPLAGQMLVVAERPPTSAG